MNIYCSAAKYTDPNVDPLTQEDSNRKTDCNRLLLSLLRPYSHRLLHRAGSVTDLPAGEGDRRAHQPLDCWSFLRRTVQRTLPAEVPWPEAALTVIEQSPNNIGKRCLNIDRSRSAQSRRGVDNSRERGRKPSRRCSPERHRRDVDIAPWSTEGVGQDLAIIQNDELRIDRNVAAASYPALNARRDMAVGQMHE